MTVDLRVAFIPWTLHLTLYTTFYVLFSQTSSFLFWRHWHIPYLYKFLRMYCNAWHTAGVQNNFCWLSNRDCFCSQKEGFRGIQEDHVPLEFSPLCWHLIKPMRRLSLLTVTEVVLWVYWRSLKIKNAILAHWELYYGCMFLFYFLHINYKYFLQLVFLYY